MKFLWNVEGPLVSSDGGGGVKIQFVCWKYTMVNSYVMKPIIPVFHISTIPSGAEPHSVVKEQVL